MQSSDDKDDGHSSEKDVVEDGDQAEKEDKKERPALSNESFNPPASKPIGKFDDFDQKDQKSNLQNSKIDFDPGVVGQNFKF